MATHSSALEWKIPWTEKAVHCSLCLDHISLLFFLQQEAAISTHVCLQLCSSCQPFTYPPPQTRDSTWPSHHPLL